MAYDQGKDKMFTNITPVTEDDGAVVTIGVFAYNGGPKRLRVQRHGESRKGEYHESLAKLTADELKYITDNLAAIQAALAE